MFHLHRAERTDALADALGEVLASPLTDPMATEVVVVPAPGVERWLQQRLARRLGSTSGAADGYTEGGGTDGGPTDGIAANIDFVSPARLSDAITVAITRETPLRTRDAPGNEVPWQIGDMVWAILRVLDRRIADPALEAIARHIGSGRDDSPRIGRRYATARHLAELFDRYGRARPTMLAAWARGDDQDGTGSPLPLDHAWQAEVWRAVRDEIGLRHPAESLEDVCTRLATGPAPFLTERISVFGPTRITESFRKMLAAAAVGHEVHLFVPHPSPRLWDSLVAHSHVRDSRAAAGAHVAPSRAGRVRPAIANPLLAALSRDVQELQLLLGPLADTDVRHEPRDPGPPTTLLGALQAGIRDDDATGALPADDSTVEIHACHGAERQVEVLRDRLLHLFADDPTLEPRDVLIMCPDVETFAPLIRGVFGQAGMTHPAFGLRVRLADRGPRQVNPVLDVVAGLVDLAAGRVTAGEVVDLLGRAPVRRRFAMSDDDLELVREWLVHANVRWGIGGRQRARYGLGRFRQGTFDAGLDRITLGVVAEENDDEWLGTALPLAGVESTDIDLVGRLNEFVARLEVLLERLSPSTGSATADHWLQALTDAVDHLTATEVGDEWQRGQTFRLLGEALADPGGGAQTAPPTRLRLPDVRDLMSVLVAGRPTRANFRTGELTVCTMVPMRSVPHRVIVLLGIDAEVFPRVQRIDGDDILGIDPLVGERNPRDEDRQCFLDAICAAEDALLVFYSGADAVSGRRIPPAVVVSELEDAVRVAGANPDAHRVAAGPAEGAGLHAPVRRHTLHGFDARNFTPGAFAGIRGPLSYDTALLAGARALRTEPVPSAVPADISLPAVEAEANHAHDIDLAALVDFHTAPIAGYVRQSLGARIPTEETAHDDELDVHLDPLETWGIGERFLSRMLAGASITDCQAAELRRGTLPPFAFGTRELRSISRAAQNLHRAVDELRAGPAGVLDVVVALADGRRVHGTVPDVYREAIISASYSRLRAKQRLAAWIRFVAVCAAADQGNPAAEAVVRAAVVGRALSGAGTAQVTYRRPADAVEVLEQLVRVRDEGLRRPLPLPIDAAAVLVEREAGGRRSEWGLTAARREYESRYGAHTDPYLRYAFGGDVLAEVGFDTLLGHAGDGDEPLFAVLARAVWVPIADHAEVR